MLMGSGSQSLLSLLSSSRPRLLPLACDMPSERRGRAAARRRHAQGHRRRLRPAISGDCSVRQGHETPQNPRPGNHVAMLSPAGAHNLLLALLHTPEAAAEWYWVNGEGRGVTREALQTARSRRPETGVPEAHTLPALSELISQEQARCK